MTFLDNPHQFNARRTSETAADYANPVRGYQRDSAYSTLWWMAMCAIAVATVVLIVIGG